MSNPLEVRPEGPKVARQPDLPAANTDSSKLVFLVEKDEALARDWSVQLGYFGYAVQPFSDLCGLCAAIGATRPAAIILDAVSFEDEACGMATMGGIHSLVAKPVPVLFISARSDMKSRLQAVHTGCDAYFTKPLDLAALIDKLDALTSTVPIEPYRVLIAEDPASLAVYYAEVLKEAGMVVEVIGDPMQTLDKLAEFRPDLVLLDLYMPACDGFELAAVIRQQEEFVGISIVFLSDEDNLSRQLFALRLGGDDFLIKPIAPDCLISVVTSRIERSRVLRSFMVRDGLTGLLNHTAIKEQLEIQLARTKRLNGKLSFAMIDIDHFKSVNDIYGHMVGDRVLKSLSRLLQQRLRVTDILGRYGGEEFAVILNDTDGPVAMKVLDQVREDMSHIRYFASGQEFSITFSGGVADYPNFTEMGALNEAADKAMYEAKRGGRNRLILAQG
ncbi:MAG: diguanylate cyclase [Betaproteobacteria bacterium]